MTRLPSLVTWLTLAGCGADMGLTFRASEAMDGGDSAPSETTGAEPGGGSEEPEAPDDDFLAMPPAQTDVFVFVANPARDTITRIDVHTLEVLTTQVGADPRIVITTPDFRRAVVFNRGADSVSLIEAATLARTDVPVRDNFNQMKMSPDGAFVALWHDLAAERPDDPPAEGLQSFNETSFVDVERAVHFPMAVGFNPRDVVFSHAGDLAVVISDEYLAVVDLLAETPSPRLIRLEEDTLVEPPPAEEVVLSDDGTWAFVRQFGTDDLLVVDLVGGEVTSVPVGENPTDLDLSPDGRQAVVLSRGSQELWLLDAAAPFEVPEVIPVPGGEAFGSVLFDPTGDQAVLYTTAAPTDRYATWDLDSDEIVVRSLVKPVRSMAITPTGTSMLVFHTEGDAPDADPDSPFRGEWAMTMIALDDFRTNPLLLPAEPIGFANATDGRRGYFIMDGTPKLEILDYHTLLHTELSLRSEPVYVGVLPDLDLGDADQPPAWVSQEHDLGRISFYNPLDGTLETITGFELNGEIE